MALIDLTLIGKLHLQAFQGLHLIKSCSYDSEIYVDNQTFVRLYRTFVQSENLRDKLTQLHQVCIDLSTGNLAPYQKKHDDFNSRMQDDFPFDPLDEIARFFDDTTVDDLPAKIEKYTELCDLAATYNAIKKHEDEGFRKFFPTLEFHLKATDQEDNVVMVPESEVPEDTLMKIDANQEIKNINVEHCLDSYNDFYATAKSIFTTSLESGEQNAWQPCAVFILSLFKPVKAKS